jgi:predicted CoA-binding protein
MILTTAGQRRDLLDSARLVAVVGASANPLRASYFVYKYLRAHGVNAFPVNPAYPDIEGVPCYPSLAAFAAAMGPPDIVDVFRKPSEAPGVARDAVAAGAKAIWFQYGVINQEAIKIADEAGLLVVVDRCMKVEHARFDGGLSTAGMNSGVISARRRV